MNFREAAEKIPQLLSQHLQLEVRHMREESAAERGESVPGADLVVALDGLEFDVQYKHRARTEQVGQAIRAIQKRRGVDPDHDSIPILVVPYMGEVGRKLCEDAGVAWMDLSGNAWIHSGKIRISVLGRENKFKRRGRPANLFAPKSARIVRILLVDHGRSFFQQELADLADVDPGHVSRVARRLEDAGLVERDRSRRLFARDPNLLLDAWADEYDPDEHRAVKGHLAVRKPEDALDRLRQVLQQSGIEFALTGLPAAWIYVRHAGYRLITLFVEAWPDTSALEQVGWRDQEEGGNVWLLRPNDIGVFYGAVEGEGYRCVSAVQTYLDLRHLPERAPEAAEVVREKCLSWDEDGS